jgi:hypothetical protein
VAMKWNTRDRLHSALRMHEWGYYDDALMTVARIIAIEVDNVNDEDSKEDSHEQEKIS